MSWGPSKEILDAYNEVIKKSIGWDYYKVGTDMSYFDWINYASKYVPSDISIVGQTLYEEGYPGYRNYLTHTLSGSIFADIPTEAGTVQQKVSTNLLPTEAVYNAEAGTLNTTWGNVVSETGEVTKKGLRLGASTGAKVAGGIFAATGAVMTGVNWYKDNPEFWTDLSQKILPFAYKDPTDKSWGDIFQEALFPTAVDDSGTTYLPAQLIETLTDTLATNGVYNVTSETTTEGIDESLFTGFEVLKDVTIQSTTAALAYAQGQLNLYYGGITDRNVPVTLAVYQRSSGEYERIFAIFADKQSFSAGSSGAKKTLDELIADSRGLMSSVSLKSDYTGIKLPEQIATRSIVISTRSPGETTNIHPSIPVLQVPAQTKSGMSELIAYIMLFGKTITKTPVEGVTPQPNAVYPEQGKPLSETYPDWYKNAQTTVNPNWKPSEPESDENPKYIVWLPVQIPSDDTPDGDTEPDTDQDTAQKGKPTPNPSVDPTTDQAINDGVLPNPNPNPDTETSVNPSPQPDPSPDPTPDPTDPDTPGKTPTPTPTPDVPGIGGGTANALWKIYNPSHSILQEFGAWLWSDNPIKLIKEIFGNNPADGIVGLHMIYVTPPIGGTANIKVGYVDSGVASPWVSQQYVTIDCGSVVIPMRYQSALDFGYTKVYCYLPFIGIVPLDSFDIIGKTVKIKYTVDILTGTVLAQISVSLGSYSAVLYTFNGSCSVEYPLTSGSRASQMLSLVTGAVGGAVVGGAGGALLGGVRGAASGADVRMSGNISGNAGAMGIRKPYIIVKRPVEVPARNYPAFYGYPANITGRLNSFSGYTRVKDVHVDNISGATAEEKREIESLLKSGVIV